MSGAAVAYATSSWRGGYVGLARASGVPIDSFSVMRSSTHCFAMLQKAFLLLVLLFAGVSSIHAQVSDSAAAVPFGARVRVFAPRLATSHWEAVVLGQRGDTLLLGGSQSLRGEVPIPTIDRIEVRRGADYPRGIRRGALAGAAVLGALYLLEAQDSYRGARLSELATTLVWGAGLGGFVGFVLAPARWETVFQRSVKAR